DDVLQIDILKPRRAFIDWRLSLRSRFDRTVCFGDRRATAVVHIETNRVGRNVFHNDVTDPNLLDNSAATSSRLEAKAEIGSKESTSTHYHVSHTAGHLAADGKSAVTVINGTV